MNSIWFVSTAKKNYEKKSRPQNKTLSPNQKNNTIGYETRDETFFSSRLPGFSDYLSHCNFEQMQTSLEQVDSWQLSNKI